MPVVPWKTRKKNGELIAKLYRQNQRLKQRVKSARRDALCEVRDLMDHDRDLSLDKLRRLIGERIENNPPISPE